jgi:hypothetical protein
MKISIAVKKTPAPEPVLGLYRYNENDPINSTLTLTDSGLIDGNKTTQVQSHNWNKNDSYAVDLGTAGEVAGVDLYCETTYGTPTDWYQPGNGWGTVGLYKSDDNITWSLIEEQVEPSNISSSAGLWNFRCMFPSNQTARYFKIRCNCTTRNWFAVEGGSLIQIAEIELILP